MKVMSNPIRPNLKTELVPILFVLVSIILSFYFFVHFPERVATHWGINGEANGWSSRSFAAFFFPALNLAIYLLMFFVPILDPKKANYEHFRTAYHAIKGALVIFLSLIYLVVGMNGLGYGAPVSLVVPVGIGALFVIIGYYLDCVKQNWFLGIRTPWTLSSELVWQKTHHFGSRVFIIGGVLLALAAFFPQALWIFLIVIFMMLAATILYSYLIYRLERKSLTK
ncbi:MAG: hypothetical protein UV02_C0026G0001 [Candidatus Kuenenbacteria bacterium GW2011_GWA2_42_15]|uniref:DUF1648 domain-containing protein n=2 Tax=Candidatus Kueneniibacteriota TaxID=1752740 RepID=A0A0G0YXZ6_9BACT|nr:MAG: hypothetical protein UV02_C0026G0001 [Candidatus Kuenenbacteria bacterium GW2011_GWA2_42_15]